MEDIEVKVKKLIEVKLYVGDGTEEDPVRKITQYWDFNGKLLFIFEDEN